MTSTFIILKIDIPNFEIRKTDRVEKEHLIQSVSHTSSALL